MFLAKAQKSTTPNNTFKMGDNLRDISTQNDLMYQ